MFQKTICQLIIILGLFSSYQVLAVKSFPPLVPEGEQLANSPEELQALLKNINRRSFVLSIVYSPDGKHLAIGSSDNTVRLWEVATGKELQRFEGHNSTVRSVAFSPNGKHLVSGSDDNTVRLWEVATGKELQRFEGHKELIFSVAYSPPNGKFLASGSSDNTVRLWEVTTDKELQLEGHNKAVKSVTYSPDGKHLATGSEDNTVRLWEITTGKELQRLEGHNSTVWSVAYSPDGKHLASSSEDNTVRLWEVATGKELQRFEKHKNLILSIIYSPDGKHLAAGSEDNTVRLWEVATGKELHRLEGHNNIVRSVAYSPDGKYLASGSDDNTVRLWEVATGKELQRFEGHRNLVLSVAYSPDGKLMASGSDDNTIRVWEMATGKELQRLEGHNNIVRSVAYSPDSKYLVSGSYDNTVRLWEMTTGKELQKFEGHNNVVRSVAYSPDGKYVVSGSDDKSVRLWEVATGKELRQLEEHNNTSWSVAYSPDSKYLASDSNGNTVRLWEVATGKELRQLEGHNKTVRTVAYSSDGRHLISGSDDGTVRLWEVTTGTELRRFEGHNSIVRSVVYSPDGKHLASGSDDGTVRMWEIATGKELQRSEGLNSTVWSIAYSPDGKYLASGLGCDGISLELLLYSRLFINAFGCTGGGNIIKWQVENGQMQSFYIGGQSGTWLSCQATGKCLRYDDGTLLKQRDETGRLMSILPPKEDGQLEITNRKYLENTHILQVEEGESKEFTLTLKNNGQGRVYWINVIHDIVRDKDNKSPLTFDSETIAVLKPNETKEVKVQVSALETYDHPPGKKRYPLNLRITHAHGERDPIKIDVDVYTPNLKLLQQKSVVKGEYFKFEDLGEIIEAIKNWNFFKPTHLLVSIQNKGGQALTEAVFRASLSNITLDNITRELVKAGETFNLSYALPENISVNEKTYLNFVAKKVLHPIHEWSFENQSITIQPPPWYFYAVPVITVFILFVLLYYWRVFRHPLVIAVSQKGLSTLALEELVPAQRWLQRAKRLQTLLIREQMPEKRWQTALDFSQTTDAQERCQHWINQLNYEPKTVKISTIAPWLFVLKLDRDFILNIECCFLAFPSTIIDEDELNKILQKTATTRILIGILISADLEHYEKLVKVQQKLSQNEIIWTIPTRNDLTRFLLAPPTKTRQTFAQLIAAQAKITRISPYKTGGGVEKSSLFFGRIQQISDIIGQEPKNYLLVGARQIGKTSLLKELERRYQQHTDIKCFYFSISKVIDSLNFQRQLADSIGLKDAELTTIQNYLAHPPQGKRYVLLIDEVDDFIYQEAKNKYETLHILRDLSAEGSCYFILAGFWDLYQAIYADYHSPLKNFGETMRLGGLETEACHALATEPMRALNIDYAAATVVEEIIKQTGRRANLVASVCNQTLSLLGNRRTIEQQDIERVLDTTEIRDLVLGDWDRTEDDQQSLLLRTIVYTTVNQDSFTENELWQQLDKLIDFPYQPQQVNEALSRLELAFILEREQDQYRYCVPLFYNLLRKKDLSDMLKRELAYFNRKFKT